MANTSKSSATRAKRKARSLAYPVEFRLRVVRLYLEEGYGPKLLIEKIYGTPLLSCVSIFFVQLL